MSLINDQLLADAAAHIDSDGFAESVTYIKGTGATRTIYAVVDRGVVEAMTDAAPASVKKITITVVNSATTGIASTELDNLDRVRLDAELDGVLMSKTINPHNAVIDQGMLRLELR